MRKYAIERKDIKTEALPLGATVKSATPKTPGGSEQDRLNAGPQWPSWTGEKPHGYVWYNGRWWAKLPLNK